MNANGRYCIRLRSGETMAVRPECCDPVLERAPSEIAVPKFDSLTKPKLNAPTIDLGALTAEAREVYSAIYAGEAIILRTEQKQTRGWLGSELADVTMFVITVDVGSWANLFSAAIVIPSKGPINSTTQWLATTDAAGIDPAPDGVASACHPAEPVSCGRYDGAVTKFGGWKGKRFAVV